MVTAFAATEAAASASADSVGMIFIPDAILDRPQGQQCALAGVMGCFPVF